MPCQVGRCLGNGVILGALGFVRLLLGLYAVLSVGQCDTLGDRLPERWRRVFARLAAGFIGVRGCRRGCPLRLGLLLGVFVFPDFIG
jgi:hypothetical protein